MGQVRACFCLLLTHRWWAAQMEQACHRQGKSTWASSHSSAGRRLRRNTEDGRKLKLDMAHRAASSPTEKTEREQRQHVKVIKLHSRTNICGICLIYCRTTEAMKRVGQWSLTCPPLSMSGIILKVYSQDRWEKLAGLWSQFHSLDQIVVCLELKIKYRQNIMKYLKNLWDNLVQCEIKHVI